MEVSRSKSRVKIIDPIYQKVQNLRYSKHLRSLQNLKGTPPKHKSQYLKNEDNIATQLDRYKKYQKQAKQKLNPPDVQYKNCLRRLHDIEKNPVKLPKINNIKLKENRIIKQEKKHKIQSQNKFLENTIAHLSHQKSIKRKELSKSIQDYELYRKLSRRVKQKKKSNCSQVGEGNLQENKKESCSKEKERRRQKKTEEACPKEEEQQSQVNICL